MRYADDLRQMNHEVTSRWIKGEHQVSDAAGRKNKIAEGHKAMGIDWMTRAELSQAIPPAYTEWIGRQLMTALQRSAAA